MFNLFNDSKMNTFYNKAFLPSKKQTGIDRRNWNFTSSRYQTWSIWFWNWNWFLIPNTTPDSNWTGWILLSNVKCDLIFRIQTAPLLSVRFIFIFTTLVTTVIISAALYRFKVLPPSEQWFSGAQSLQQNKSYFTYCCLGRMWCNKEIFCYWVLTDCS